LLEQEARKALYSPSVGERNKDEFLGRSKLQEELRRDYAVYA
jgi:hypothetical protein